MSFQPKISIITIAFNAEKDIDKTIQSVINQTYKNIEYVIIDGASRDNTLNIINKYRDKISKLVSEPDKGIYDAMNKGIKYSLGDYIWFMNAGDVIYENETLEKLISNSDGEDFIYGDTLVISENGNTKPYHKKKPNDKTLNYTRFIDGMIICHQSMIVKRDKAAQYDFTRFKISCDIEWCIKTTKNCSSFKDSGIYLSKFLDGGLSQTNKLKAVKERFWICVKHFGWQRTILQNIKIGFSFVLNTIYKLF